MTQDVWSRENNTDLLCKLLTVLSDLSKVDSFVMDPLKSMITPFGVSVALLRNKSTLPREHLLAGPMEALRAFTMWFTVNLFGENTFRSQVNEKLLLAQYFHHELQRIPGVVANISPTLTIIVFRCDGTTMEAANARSKLLRDKVEKQGRFRLSSFDWDGYYYLRVCLQNFRVHLTGLQSLLAKIQAYVSNILRVEYG